MHLNALKLNTSNTVNLYINVSEFLKCLLNKVCAELTEMQDCFPEIAAVTLDIQE